MGRVYNFSAGPAVLPEEVLKEAADEMLDYKGCGMSVMEMSHRSKVFDDIIKEAEQDLRDLMNIPDNYKVLFLQGGASQQFSAIPMNLMKNGVADYIVTGQWAKKAYQEASRYGKAVKIASSEDKTFSYIPDCSDLPNLTIPSPNEPIISSSETFWFLPPPQAGYPRSEVSKNMARGRFLCVRDVSFFLNIPPLTWLYIAASVAVNAVRTPSNVTYAIGSNNNL